MGEEGHEGDSKKTHRKKHSGLSRKLNIVTFNLT